MRKFKIINKKCFFLKLYEYTNIFLEKIDATKRKYKSKQFKMNWWKLKDKIFYYFFVIIEKLSFIIFISIYVLILFLIPSYISFEIFKLPDFIGWILIMIYISIIFYISGRLKNNVYFINDEWKLINNKWYYSVISDFSHLKLKGDTMDDTNIKLINNKSIYEFFNYIDKWYLVVSRMSWVLWNTIEYNIVDENKNILLGDWLWNNQTFLIENIVNWLKTLNKNRIRINQRISSLLKNASTLEYDWDYNGAINIYNKIIKIDSTNVYALFWKARDYFYLEKDNEAITIFKLINLDIVDKDIKLKSYVILGQIYYNLWKDEESLKYNILALEMDPNNKTASFYKGRIEINNESSIW